MPEFTKGGRGKQAPYESTHCRVPVPLKPLIDEIIARYKETLDSPDELMGQVWIDNLREVIPLDVPTPSKPVNKIQDNIKPVNRLQDILNDWKGKTHLKEKQPRWANVVKLLEELESIEK